MPDTKTEIEIEGMSCEHCVNAVTQALKAVAGVKDAKVEIGKAVITSDAPLARDAIVSAVADEGYRVRGS
jgi:copper chaperone CopZ